MKTGQADELVIRSLCLPSSSEAVKEFKRIGVDPEGIARMLPKLAQITLLIPDVRSAAANILKQEMLSLGGDAAVARGTVACLIKKTDVMLIGTRKQLSALSKKLQGQPFGLASLAIKIEQILINIEKPAENWHTSRRIISLKKPLIMGILNVTPDSFSDGGCFYDVSKAVEHALKMADEGADIIDLGGESTRPGACTVQSDVEISRILPVIDALANRLSIPLSVDTWKSQVADAALNAGAEIINDISGLNFDADMPETAAKHQAGLVLMHTRGKPQDMQQNTNYPDLMGEISSYLHIASLKALSAGVPANRIALDPGIGFAKELDGNLEILRRLQEFESLGYPLLVGTSRKSFIGKTLQKKDTADRLFGTAATVALAVASGAKILRVHDVKAMKDVALMADAIINPPS